MNDHSSPLKALTGAILVFAAVALFWAVVLVLVLTEGAHVVAMRASEMARGRIGSTILYYAISVLIAAPITFLWSSFLHNAVRYLREDGDAEKEAKRVVWIPALMGMLERAIITTLIGWNVSGAAGFIGAWLAIKAAGGWSSWSKGSTYGRSVFFVGLMGSALSIGFGIVGGILILIDGTHPK